ncbi:hypothetical protein OG738_15880 [Amycolatopsis sp. NBC_01488]|uniref:hypothetical protein n=1 Tax=Amycolatopsis sp. NBC_01488 TaxID=2903563 RepID=UPI002E27DC82|nr:hypothetical protein [Amycolatopsis sp. NBC_01488]
MITRPGEQAGLTRLGELRFRAFSGTRVVDIAPAQWGLAPIAIRQAAVSRRYREVPPGLPGFLRFEFAPGSFPPHFDRGPGTEADRRRLAKLLTGQEQFWASSRRLRLGRDDVAAIAAAGGMAVVAEVSDSTDRLLLLRRAGLPAEELRPRTTRRRFGLAEVQTSAFVLSVVVAGVGTWLAAASERKWPLLLIPVFLAVAIGPQLAIRGFAGRSPRMPWLDENFTGGWQVVVAPPPSMSTELLCEVASLYGYFYAGQYYVGRNSMSHLFAKCRPGLVFGTPAPGVPPAPPPVFEAPAESPGREQWLRTHLDGRDELWVSVRHAKLPPDRIAAIAGPEGLVPVAEFADPSDRIVLLRRPTAPPPAPGRKFRMSFVGFLAPAAWVVLCFGGGCLTAVLTGENRLFGIAFGLTVLGVPPLLWVLRVFPRSTRVGWLAREFTGKDGVTFFSGQFDVSPGLVRQIAGYHGYFFGSQTYTRAQGTLVTYVRQR